MKVKVVNFVFIVLVRPFILNNSFFDNLVQKKCQKIYKKNQHHLKEKRILGIKNLILLKLFMEL